MKARHLLPVVAAVVAAGALVGLGHATTPGANGLIAFTRYRLQDNPLWSEIYVANPDGTGTRRVSSSPTAVEDNHAQWSPDGKRILFDRCTKIECSIWIVDADGTHQRRLTHACPPSDPPTPACPDDSFPSFAPDGDHIVFVRAIGANEIVWRL
jgi:Tol biopolymer transport system component